MPRIILFLIGAGVVAFTQFIDMNTSYVTVHGEKIYVEVVDTFETRTKGLMGRELLSEDEGMLFIFPENKIRTFWMKNMKISIDIIFIDEKQSIINMYTDVEPCHTFKCDMYYSAKEVKYVLELKASETVARNMQVGDIIDFSLLRR